MLLDPDHPQKERKRSVPNKGQRDRLDKEDMRDIIHKKDAQKA